MDIRDLLHILRRWLRLLILAVVVGTLVGFGYAWLQPKSYSSTTTLLVGQPFTATTDTLAANQLQAQTYADIATLRPMLQKVIDALGLQESPGDLARQVLVEASHTSNILTVTASNPDPNTAASIAGQLAAQLIAVAPAPTGVSGPATLAVVDPAVAATSPSYPKVSLLTGLGAAAGLLVAAIIIALIMQGERRARRLEARSEEPQPFTYQVTVAPGSRLELPGTANDSPRWPPELPR